MPSEAEIEAAARAHDDEWERWIFRRKIDKSGYEAVREHDTSAPISEDNQTVFNLDRDGDTAEANFTVIRSHAATKSALEAAERARWQPMPPPDGEHVLLWWPIGERGVGGMECATVFSDDPYSLEGMAFWTHGGPNAGSDWQPRDGEKPTRWQPLPSPPEKP